jgi:hypothetical protein
VPFFISMTAKPEEGIVSLSFSPCILGSYETDTKTSFTNSSDTQAKIHTETEDSHGKISLAKVENGHELKSEVSLESRKVSVAHSRRL